MMIFSGGWVNIYLLKIVGIYRALEGNDVTYKTNSLKQNYSV